MDQIVKMVSEKAGISPEQAKTAVNTVMGFIKDKMPSIGGSLDGIMGGGGAGNIADGLKDKLPGGLGNFMK